MFTPTTLLWIAVCGLAVFAGIAAARWLHKPNEWYLQRGICPSCKARKSLLIFPIAINAVKVGCGRCTDEWIIEQADGFPILNGPVPRVSELTLHFRIDQLTGNPIFRTDVGEAEYSLKDVMPSALPIHAMIGSPRDLLKALYRTKVAPIRFDPNPVIGEEGEPIYNHFLETAGVVLDVQLNAKD